MGTKKAKFTMIGFAALASAILFQNCNGFKSHTDSSDDASTAIASEPEMLKPSVACNLIRVSDNTVLRTINSLTPAESFTASVVEGESVRLDCSPSKALTDNASISGYTLTKDTRTLSGSTLASSSGVFDLSFPKADRVPMQLDLVDSAGQKTTKLFDIVIRCSTEQQPPVINDQAVSVQSAATTGFFNFSAAGAVSGGRAPYQYSWDFQGDTGIDFQPQMAGWVTWSDQATVSNVYSMFANLRKVRLQVRDACNLVAMKEVDRNFNLPRLAAATPASPQAFYYLQGDIRPEAAAPATFNPRVTNVDLMAVQPLSPPDKRIHMQCFYNRDASSGKAVLKIVAKNTYGSESEVQFNHGASLEIQNISDGGESGAVSVGSPVIKTAQYNVAGIADFSDPALFSKSAECNLQLKVQRMQGQAPCADGSTVKTEVVQFLGDFNCPSLRTPASAGVSIDNGKFFCEKGSADQCVGGGGGGGGNPPPAQ